VRVRNRECEIENAKSMPNRNRECAIESGQSRVLNRVKNSAKCKSKGAIAKEQMHRSESEGVKAREQSETEGEKRTCANDITITCGGKVCNDTEGNCFEWGTGVRCNF
jgi:hypothetical protein